MSLILAGHCLPEREFETKTLVTAVNSVNYDDGQLIPTAKGLFDAWPQVRHVFLLDDEAALVHAVFGLDPNGEMILCASDSSEYKGPEIPRALGTARNIARLCGIGSESAVAQPRGTFLLGWTAIAVSIDPCRFAAWGRDEKGHARCIAQHVKAMMSADA